MTKRKPAADDGVSETIQPVQPPVVEPPWKKAATRSMASFGTWFCTEYPKLILQQQQQHRHSNSKSPLLVKSFQIYKATPWQHHLKGAVSSAGQRGSSAWIMFYGQAFISQSLYHDQDRNGQQPPWWTAGIAGALGGGISSLVHSIFEPIKIRHEPFSWRIYKASVWPMMWRHALFDGTFFATSTLMDSSEQYSFSYATQFGLSALAASAVNLTHDLWKTQYIRALPRRLKWVTVVQSLSRKSFRQQLVVKAADLGFNWWVTGLLYAYLFVNNHNRSSEQP